VVVLNDSGQLESKASQSSFPLSPVLLTRLEHAVDNTGYPLHDTPQRMLPGFALLEPEYQREVAAIKQAIGKRRKAKPA
jgi:hypothetical protein